MGRNTLPGGGGCKTRAKQCSSLSSVWVDKERIAPYPVPTCPLLQALGKQGLQLSPMSSSFLAEVYAQLCNVARIEAEREAGVHFRPGYEYSPGPDDLHYGLYGPDGAPFYNYLGPEDTIPELPFPNAASPSGDRTPIPESPLQPSELQPRYVASQPGLCGCKGWGEVDAEAVPFHLPHLSFMPPVGAWGRCKEGGKTNHARCVCFWGPRTWLFETN